MPPGSEIVSTGFLF